MLPLKGGGGGGHQGRSRVTVVHEHFVEQLARRNFRPVPKVIPNIRSDCFLLRKQLCFSPVHLSNRVWVQVCALQFLKRTEDFHDLGMNWNEAHSSRHVSSKFQTTAASITRMIVFHSHIECSH